MSALYKNSAAANDVSDRRPRCSCLPFCFWRGGGSSSSRSNSRRTTGSCSDAPGTKKRHRWRRFRLIRLSWLAFSWPWLRKSGGTKTTTGKKKRGRRLLLLLRTSLQAEKALSSVVSGASGGLILPATVSSFGDVKRQNKSKPPRPTADAAAPAGGTRQPQQASTTGAGSTAAAAARRGTNQPCKTTTTDEPTMATAAAGRIWRAPSRRHSFHQLVRAERPAGGLWTAATTLGVIVLLGRVTAVVFLCSCLYGARFVRAWAAGGASAKNSGGVDAGASSSSSSRLFGDPVGEAAEKVVEPCVVTDECKKKAVMEGLLERPGKRPSSRFGR